jgi:hypothetical protein
VKSVFQHAVDLAHVKSVFQHAVDLAHVKSVFQHAVDLAHQYTKLLCLQPRDVATQCLTGLQNYNPVLTQHAN